MQNFHWMDEERKMSVQVSNAEWECHLFVFTV